MRSAKERTGNFTNVTAKKPKEEAKVSVQDPDEEKRAQETLEKELAEKDPKMAEQVKAMMAGMLQSRDKEEAPSAPEPPKDTCKNCMKPCEKPLRCSVCKAASYCTPTCQKEDWQFHKRNCKKPTPQPKKEEGNVEEATRQITTEAPSAAAAAGTPVAGTAPPRPTGPQKEVVEGEDVGTWYSHRNWKPQEEKKEFIPEKVDGAIPSAAPETASVWNAAGTWEEKVMVPWWQKQLEELKATSADSFAGKITVDALDLDREYEASAQILHIRGTPRFLFDLRFHLDVSCQYPTSSRAYKGKVRFTEFSNEAAQRSDEPFPVEVTAQSDPDKKAIEQAFVPKVQDALREFIKEYQAQVATPEGGAFPGQLPPTKK